MVCKIRLGKNVDLIHDLDLAGTISQTTDQVNHRYTESNPTQDRKMLGFVYFA